MNRCLSMTGVLAVVLSALAASAQETIVFSKPADLSADKANSFIGSSSRAANAGSISAPKQMFTVPEPTLPMPPPVYQHYQDPSVTEALNKRNNWRLLTPEQIMGLQTVEEIMGLADRGTDRKLSLEEKFLLRQSQGSRSTVTNARSGLLARENNNPFEQNRDDQLSFNQKSALRTEDLSPNKSPWAWSQATQRPDGSSPDEAGASPMNSAWQSAFAQPSRPVPFGQSPEEIARMERFRALMDPPSAAPDPAIKTTRAQPVSAPAFFQNSQPAVNPAGRSAVAVQVNIARPKGIQPLPAATGSTLTPQTKKPEWQAQPPPWMTDKPQPQSRVRNYGK
jgi:hypothetical protein